MAQGRPMGDSSLCAFRGRCPFGTWLTLVSALPEELRDSREIELRLALATPFYMVRGVSAPETLQSYDRARDLAEKQGNAHQLFQAVYGSWQVHAASGR